MFNNQILRARSYVFFKCTHPLADPFTAIKRKFTFCNKVITADRHIFVLLVEGNVMIFPFKMTDVSLIRIR